MNARINYFDKIESGPKLNFSRTIKITRITVKRTVFFEHTL